MKKILKHAALLVSALALVACGSTKKASDNGTASNSNFEVSIKDGMYVLPKDEDSSSKYLALQVEIKNNRDKKFSFTSRDITLYNEKDEKVEPIQIYESDSKTKFMSYGESSGGGTNLSTSDNKAQIVSLADDKKSSDGDAEFTNDVKADREEFIKKFVESFGKGFYNYKPSDAELRTFAEAYIKANAKRAKIDYKVKTYLPDYAVIYVRPETIDLDNLNVYELSRKFYDENKGKYSNYSEAMKAGEKYILENAPSQFESTPLDTSNSMRKEGYEIKMTKKDGKWTIDTSSKNYDLKDMARTFRGGIGY